jgi:hypothetical protein
MPTPLSMTRSSNRIKSKSLKRSCLALLHTITLTHDERMPNTASANNDIAQ